MIMMIDNVDIGGVSKYGPKSLFQLAMDAVEASGRITQIIFDAIKKADKEIEQFTQNLEKNKIPNTVSAINNQQNRAEKLLAALSLPAPGMDPSTIEDQRSKLVAIMGQLQDMKQAALAQEKGAVSGSSFGSGSIV
jgi:hypothetical protein